MAHELEMVNGEASMAYAGETPWHRLGTKVSNDLTTDQMMAAAGLDWTVSKVPAFATINEKQVNIGHSALVRDRDHKVLDVVSNDWNPVQNQEAFDFFNEFVMAGDMEMHTAGSLKGGQIVWGLAKVKDSFELFHGDRVDSYMLFSNFHKYGFSTDIRFTPVRVVCNNTLTLSLNSNVDRMAKISHRKVFDAENIKQMMGIATDKLEKYKEMAGFLGSKQAKGEDLIEYFKRVFPVTGKADAKKEVSKNASTALSILPTQPGHEYAEGSWWQAFNASTFVVDHLMGRSDDNRMSSAWFGQGRNIKTNALELAVEYANA